MGGLSIIPVTGAAWRLQGKAQALSKASADFHKIVEKKREEASKLTGEDKAGTQRLNSQLGRLRCAFPETEGG